LVLKRGIFVKELHLTKLKRKVDQHKSLINKSKAISDHVSFDNERIWTL